MTVEITSISFLKGIVTIEAVDVSEENLQRLERLRDSSSERELIFVIDMHIKEHFVYLRNWLKSQKHTKGCSTYGEALSSVIGIITTISGKYLELA